jgi:hypothetical protein
MLVRLEKEDVLRKMKEQQKHSCGCAVCGRKRTAIEEELEVLYDAYYDELEQYANHQQEYAASNGNGTIPPPAGPGPFPGSVELDRNGLLIRPDHLAPPPPPPMAPSLAQAQARAQQQQQQHGGEEYDSRDGEEDDEEEEEYSDDGAEDDEEVRCFPFYT